jgi:uncharacterized protein involved in exopolysaccharide biosynthesis
LSARAVADLRPQLEEAEGTLRKLKLERYGALPEQLEANLRNLDQTTMEVDIQSTNLDLDLERRRTMLGAALSSLRHHEETLAAQLYDARTRYTDDHPEVARIRDEYERVRQQRLDDEADLDRKLRTGGHPELAALDGEITRTRAMLAGLRERQVEVRRRVEATARNGQELAALQLGYDAVKDKYAAALSRARDAELAAAIERSLAELRFDLVEAASVPTRAGSPNRALLGLGAVVLALALGLGVGFALDAADHSLRDAADMRALAPSLPVLACVPRARFGDTHPEPEA